jgi:predicted RNA-binding protein with RPS1 domain
MNTVKTINICGNMFALPDGMPAKDVQALAGFLCSLSQVRSDYNYDTSSYLYSLGDGVQVQIADRDLINKEEALTIEKESRARYQAKRKAEEAAAAGDLLAMHVNS